MKTGKGIGIGIAAVTITMLVWLFWMLSTDKVILNTYHFQLTREEGKEVFLVRVSGLDNKFTQYKLNQNIQKDFLLLMEDFFERPCFFEDEGLTSLIVGNHYLSIAMGYKIEHPRHNYYKAVYNLDTGERVQLDDLFELNDDFIKVIKLYGEDCTYDIGESLVTIFGFTDESEEYIAERLRYVSMTQEEWNEMAEQMGYKSYYKPDFLITEENLYFDGIPISLDKLEEFLKVPKWW